MKLGKMSFEPGYRSRDGKVDQKSEEEAELGRTKKRNQMISISMIGWSWKVKEVKQAGRRAEQGRRARRA